MASYGYANPGDSEETFLIQIFRYTPESVFICISQKRKNEYLFRR